MTAGNRPAPARLRRISFVTVTLVAGLVALAAGAAGAAFAVKPWFVILAAWAITLAWLGRHHPRVAIVVAAAPVMLARPVSITEGLRPQLSDVALVCSAAVTVPALRRIDSIVIRRALLLTVAGAALAVALAHQPRVAAWGLARTALAALLAAAAYRAVRARPAALATLVATFGGLASVGAIMQKVGITTLVGPSYIAGLPDSVFGYYTVFAGFVGMALVMTVGLMLQGRDRRPYLLGLAVLNGSAMVLTTSRGGLLFAVVGIGLLLIASAHDVKMLLRWAGVGVVLVGAVLTFVPSDVSALSTRVTDQGLSANSDAQRSALQQLGIHGALHQPLGLGYGNFNAYLAGHPVAGIYHGFFHCHLLLAQVVLDGGWLGAAGVVGLAVAAITGWRQRRRYPMAAVYAAAFAGMLAQGTGDYVLYEPIMLVLWLALPAAAIAATRPERTGPPPVPTPRARPTAAPDPIPTDRPGSTPVVTLVDLFDQPDSLAE